MQGRWLFIIIEESRRRVTADSV